MKHKALKGDNYTQRELIVFDALRKRPTTSVAITPLIYPNERTRPIHAGIVVTRVAITLGIKLERNREAYRLARIKNDGMRALELKLIKPGDKTKTSTRENHAAA